MREQRMKHKREINQMKKTTRLWEGKTGEETRKSSERTANETQKED